MLKKRKNHLDEMLLQQLQKIDQVGMWIAIIGLLGAIIIQTVLTFSLQQILGELTIVFLLIIYKIIASLKKGIWGNCAVPSTKQNLLFAFIPFVVILLIGCILCSIYPILIEKGFIIAIAALSVLVYIGTFVMSVSMKRAYKSKHSKLESEGR